jgi:hypothetical protein
MATTTTVLPTISRSAGTHTSPVINFGGEATSVDFAIVCPTWSTDDPAISVTLKAEQSFDSGTTWQDILSFTCHPRDMGPKDNPTSPPVGGFVIRDSLGARKLRGQLILSGALTMGLTLIH